MEIEEIYTVVKQNHQGDNVEVKSFTDFMTAVKHAWLISGSWQDEGTQIWEDVSEEVQKEYINHCQSYYAYTRVIKNSLKRGE